MLLVVQNHTNTSGKWSGSFCRSSVSTYHLPSHSVAGRPREMKTHIRTQTRVCVHGSLLCARQKTGAVQMSSSMLVDKPIVIYPDSGIPLSGYIAITVGKSQNNYVE